MNSISYTHRLQRPDDNDPKDFFRKVIKNLLMLMDIGMKYYAILLAFLFLKAMVGGIEEWFGLLFFSTIYLFLRLILSHFKHQWSLP